MEERDIIRVLSTDFSAGSEASRDALLVRCLDVLGADDDGTDLEDEELEMLAAAGDAFDLLMSAASFQK